MPGFLRLLLPALALAALALPSLAGDVPRMSKEELKGQLGSPGVVVIDVRRGGDWSGSPAKIQGAVRQDPGAVARWADQYPKASTLVLYCA